MKVEYKNLKFKFIKEDKHDPNFEVEFKNIKEAKENICRYVFNLHYEDKENHYSFCYSLTKKIIKNCKSGREIAKKVAAIWNTLELGKLTGFDYFE